MKKTLEVFSIFIWMFLIISLGGFYIGFKIQHDVYKAQKNKNRFEKHSAKVSEYFPGDSEGDEDFIFIEVNGKRKRVVVEYEQIDYGDKIGQSIDVWCLDGFGRCFFIKGEERYVEFPSDFTNINRLECNLLMSVILIPIILLFIRYR